jgi:DNA-binding MarR family transcriptional regulator
VSTTTAAPREQRMRELEAVMREASGLGVVLSGLVAGHVGISSKDLECLDVIALKGRITAGGLAAATGLTTGAVTGLIDRLEKAGLARRERDDRDRRKVFVRALPRVGTDIMPLYSSLQTRMRKLMLELSDHDVERLLAFFSASRNVLLSEIAAMKTSTGNGGKAGIGSDSG